jgi:hypothetical protein
MTPLRQNDIPDKVRKAEETLRLIARLPAPDGLAGRVQSRLATAQHHSFVSGWGGFSRNGWLYSPVLRGCAAAAIVLVVAGGGWGIYSRVQTAPTAKVIEMPARVGPGGAFSNADAIHTPNTLNGPVLVHPAAPAQQKVVVPMPSKAQAPAARTKVRKKAATAK